jgi:hypothetical protein
MMQDGSAAVASLQAFDDPSGIVFAEEIFVDDKPATLRLRERAPRKLTGAEFIANSHERAGGLRWHEA